MTQRKTPEDPGQTKGDRSGEDEVDAGAGACAPLDHFGDEFGGAGLLGAGGADDVSRVGVDVFGLGPVIPLRRARQRQTKRDGRDKPGP